jgi:hypothetical protein
MERRSLSCEQWLGRQRRKKEAGLYPLVSGGNCQGFRSEHRATRRAPNLPLLGVPTVRGLGLNSPQGVNPGG